MLAVLMCEAMLAVCEAYTTIKRVTAATADYPLYLIVRRRCWPADSDAGRFRTMLAVC